MSKITNAGLRTIALEACNVQMRTDPDSYDRGYAAGVEDLALLLTTTDPAISERLIAIVKAVGLRHVLGPTSRLGG